MFLDNEENIFRNPDTQYFEEVRSYMRKELRQAGIGFGWNLPGESKQDIQNSGNPTLYCNFPLDRIWRYIKKGIGRISFNAPGRYQQDIEYFPIERKILYCLSPWQKLWFGIDRNGDIFPDCGCIYPLGNINSDNLLDVWNNEKMQQYRRNIVMQDAVLCNKDCVSGYASKIHRSSQKML